MVIFEIVLPVLGAGLGLVMPNLTVAIQNAVDRLDIGVATSGASFARSLGGAFGVAAAGAILSRALAGLAPAAGGAAAGMSQIADLPLALRDALLDAYRQATAETFLAAAAVVAAALVIVLFLPEWPLRADDAQMARAASRHEA